VRRESHKSVCHPFKIFTVQHDEGYEGMTRQAMTRKAMISYQPCTRAWLCQLVTPAHVGIKVGAKRDAQSEEERRIAAYSCLQQLPAIITGGGGGDSEAAAAGAAAVGRIRPAGNDDQKVGIQSDAHSNISSYAECPLLISTAAVTLGAICAARDAA